MGDQIRRRRKNGYKLGLKTNCFFAQITLMKDTNLNETFFYAIC